MHRFETKGISMRPPLDMVFEFGDLLMLWICNKVEHNYLLVTFFIIHDAASFHLRVDISVNYDDACLFPLSELSSDLEQENRSPVNKTLTT